MVGKMTIWSYLEPFLYTREYMHLSDISKQLKKPHSTVRKHMNFFEKGGVMTKNKKGRMSLYKLNVELPIIIDYLVLAEKQKLIFRCENELIMNELVSFLHENLHEDNKAIIFGSAVENIRKANDIDILVVGKPLSNKKTEKFEKKIGIEMHVINVDSMLSIKETLKKEILKRHLIVQGSEEMVKWLI